MNARRTYLLGFVLILTSCTAPSASDRVAQKQVRDSSAIANDWYLRSASLYEEGRYNDSALALTDSALKFRRDDPRVWHVRGNLLGRLDDFLGARAAYDEALRLKSDYAWAWWHRGCLHAATGLPDSALFDLQHAIAIDSSFKSGPFTDDCWKAMRSDPRLIALAK